nr:P-loop NTPase fold protein [Deinococcus sp. GbtcB9]
MRFSYLTDALVELVQTDSLLPTTIGVFGDWGSGKSTILKHAEIRLNSLDDGTVCLTFNGWLFEGYEDAKSALMGNILEGIAEHLHSKKTLTDKLAEQLRGLLRRVDMLKAAKVAASVTVPLLTGLPFIPSILGGTSKDDATEATEEGEGNKVDLAGILKEPAAESARATIREFRRDFETLLQQAGISRLVVIIDDLDRCLPSTIIQTLEAIKLFLFAHRTAFLLGADERLVEYAIRERFPELPNTDFQVGQNYLEKLVQIPLRLPTLSAGEAESYIALLFAQRTCDQNIFHRIIEKVTARELDDFQAAAFTIEVARDAHAHFSERMPPALDADLAFATPLARQLHDGLGGSPRRLKRFLNALKLRELLARNRRLAIDSRVLAKLMVLEYIKTDQFRRFARWSVDTNGWTEHLEVLERAARSRDTLDTAGEVPAEVIASLPDHVRAWLDDTWLPTWLVSEPPLGKVELAPYFTIAHDKIGNFSNYASKLSPLAARLLQDLLRGTKPTRDSALRQVPSLDPADANAMLQALTTAYRETPAQDLRTIQPALMGFVGKRPELITDLLAFFQNLPDNAVYQSTPPELVQLTPEGAAGTLKTLLQRWSASSNDALKRAAIAALKMRRN